jgi:hypothetical protein
MTKRTVSKGSCEGCKAVLSKSGMTRHLANCPANASTPGTRSRGKTKLLHLIVEARWAPMYWLHLEAPAGVSLATLDTFLRNIWLECCGHLSAFQIGGVSYTSRPERDVSAFHETDQKGWRRQLDSVLRPGDVCRYQYDFGSTTELTIRMVGASEGADCGLRLLARNVPPEIPCGGCGKPATKICTECSADESGWLCTHCMQKHECGEDYVLPVVNSPRVGVCGYEG